MLATEEQLLKLEKVGMHCTIQEFYQAYKYSKNRSANASKNSYQRPFLANTITNYLIRKFTWGELDPKTQFHWEVFNPSRSVEKGVNFDTELLEYGVDIRYLDKTNPAYTANQLRSDQGLNILLDRFKDLKLKAYQSSFEEKDYQNLRTTNFSLRIPDPESKIILNGKEVGTSYFDMPFYAISPPIALEFLKYSEPVILDHKYNKGNESKPSFQSDISTILPLKHIVQLSMLQLAIDSGDPALLISEPWYI